MSDLRVARGARRMRGPVREATRVRRLGGGVPERRPAWVPRDHLQDPAAFGIDPAATYRQPADIAVAGEFMASVAQHRAALVVRTHRSAGVTVRELARRLGTDEGYLSGQLTGRYPAGLDDLARWAIALDDISVLPTFDTLTSLRPASQDGSA